MNRRRILPTIFALVVPFLAAAQQPAPSDSLTRQLARMQRQIDSLREVARRQDDRLIALDERGGASRTSGDTSSRPLASARGIYGKPFVRRFGSGTAVGGYSSTEFRSEYVNELHARRAQRVGEIGAQSRALAQNLQRSAAPAPIDRATLDYRFTEALNLRAGVILSPIGRFNITHDDPVNELTDRPLVTQRVIPGTLGETGVGFFGSLYPFEQALVTYEAYVVNGFTNDLTRIAPGEKRLNVHDAPGTRGADDASTKNFVGRLGVSPLLGVEIGVSAHVGPYGDGVELPGAPSRNATILAVDGSWRRGPLEVLGEGARLRADLSDSLRTAGVSRGSAGYYLQGNYRFGQGWLAPKPTSTFTGVVRWDQVNFATDVPGDTEQRLSLGLNWRPIGDAAFKSEYQWNWSTPSQSTVRGPAERRVVFSLASYF